MTTLADLLGRMLEQPHALSLRVLSSCPLSGIPRFTRRSLHHFLIFTLPTVFFAVALRSLARDAPSQTLLKRSLTAILGASTPRISSSCQHKLSSWTVLPNSYHYAGSLCCCGASRWRTSHRPDRHQGASWHSWLRAVLLTPPRARSSSTRPMAHNCEYSTKSA